jgi:hypothetical protein
MKHLIKKLLRESLIDEAAKRMSTLPDTTGLFITQTNSGAEMTLYDPKSDEVFATITFSSHITLGPYFNVGGVAALRGYGPFIYELAMMYADSHNSMLMPSRDGDVRGDAWNVWENFFKRSDITKNTMKLEDDLFRFDIITGDEWDIDDEEKLEYWNQEINDEDRQSLLAFNTGYSLTPNSDYRELVKRAENQPINMKGIVEKKGEEFWEDMYE